jgi:hypothetical protein
VGGEAVAFASERFDRIGTSLEVDAVDGFGGGRRFWSSYINRLLWTVISN